ncbi:MAG: TonB-dependent receptor [Salinivirgaceae bacterium]|jgi:TonB-linked SusC/RagA family outer membrane protein|nr:TonB-dependent receptor [Salinivirgaceae bacterium]
MKYTRFLFVVLVFAMVTIPTFAQQNSISGTVVDKTEVPIPGVSIVIKGSTLGTITDIDGKYNLVVENADATLVFSFIGMKKEEVAVNSQTSIDVILSEDILGLDEVVVVGYGTQAKKDVTGSVSLVSTKEMESRPNTQVGSLIQGKAAGVKVISSSGKPSQGLSIRIRGTNSITAGSEPLYVVDGVPTTDTRSINPSDVESVSILKDASSAAIYGAQGANGVVIITTKRGTTGKPKVNLDMYTGFSQVWKTIDVLDGPQYRELMEEMGQETDWDLYNKNTDWQDEIFQNGASQNVQVALSGANNNTNYYVSGGFVKQVGAVRSSEMSRANFKINLDQEVTDWLTMGSRMAYTKYSDVDVTDNTSVNSGGVLLGSLTTPSIIGIYNEDGTFTSNPFQNWENPIASTDGSDREYNTDRILGNVYAEVKILRDFSFKSSLGIDNSNSMYDYFLDPYRTSYGRALIGKGVNNTDKNSYYIFDNTLRYNKELGSHKIEALAGAVSQKFMWEKAEIERRNFASDAIKTVNGGSEIITATANKSEKANQSYLSRLNYGFANKYLLTANFRYDGSSVFGPDNRWGFFPSFSGGWRLSEESFMQSLTVISDLKLRAGWGVVGNDQIDNYAYFGRVGIGANYPIGGVVMPGTYPSSIENNKLKWEESKQTNIGFDLALYNSRLNFTVDYYIKNTSDLLLNAPLPRSTGFDNAISNIGALQNKGFEFSFKSVNIESDIVWTTDFNISFNKNKVTNLVGQEMFAGDIAGRGDAIRIREGDALGTFYGYEWGGVDPETGNAYYIDSLGESTFNPTANDRKVIGNSNPDFIYGLTNTVTYKGISFLIFLEGVKGNDMLNASRFDTEGMTDPKNQSTAVLNRWKQSGDVTDIPRASWGNTNNSRISDRFIEDGSYMRVKTMTLSYNLPKSILNKIKIQNVRLYATGENLLTFTKYSGFDPEVNAFGNDSDNGVKNTVGGIDYGTYPQTRNIIFGLNVTF